MIRNLLSAAMFCAITACGGQVAAKPLNICWQPMGAVVAIPNCDASIQTIVEADPIKSVALQLAIPGPVILWAGWRDNWAQNVANFPALIAEAKKYPAKFPWVYLYDEAGWCKTGYCTWAEEDDVLKGIEIAHAAGIKSLVTFLPDVILDPRFKLKDINAFDGISIDVYPSIRPSKPSFGNCKWNDNNTANLFYCSVQKLRNMGFRGQIGYIFQGFGIVGETHANRMAYLAEQRYVINNATAMGADAVMSWGCRLSAVERAAEPTLEPLCGTAYEYLVTP